MEEKMEKKPRCKLVEKFPNNQGGRMKCTHLVARGDISACSALDKPYVPSLFEFGEYCRTIDHRKCPFYLKDIVRSKCYREQDLRMA